MRALKTVSLAILVASATAMLGAQQTKASTQPPGYCDQVPSGIIDTAKWANAECARRKLAGDQVCVQVYTAAGHYCHP